MVTYRYKPVKQMTTVYLTGFVNDGTYRKRFDVVIAPNRIVTVYHGGGRVVKKLFYCLASEYLAATEISFHSENTSENTSENADTSDAFNLAYKWQILPWNPYDKILKGEWTLDEYGRFPPPAWVGENPLVKRNQVAPQPST